ncbi:SNF2-related protein [Rugamonas aquatica]|uniref:Helicase ATP-binding domain-containing protein n=1 Tax=Rugamonas aquatica TaxID=2743357 RepID=A0A6A7MWC8_9BURK|nr:SNF2-related protein [Rugamonas aquatica]MQA37044.1 hypothetical protein [Rugamonas aquatica]
MKHPFDWDPVWEHMRQLAAIDTLWRADQQHSLAWMTGRLQQQNGVLIADEVGLGKTRLAIALAVCVVACGGRAAIMVPPGLTYQWCEEELRGFLRQMQELKLAWAPADIRPKILRTYPDLFSAENADEPYPFSNKNKIVFMSHRFGLPQRLGAVKKDDLWALPFLLKNDISKDERRGYGTGKLGVSDQQYDAIAWLAKNLPGPLRKRLRGSELGRASTATLTEDENSILFRNLIGELVGDFELLVIDEAHKNRAGTEYSSTEKALSTTLQSRLSACIRDILLRPGSVTADAKRVALTATPMEMDVSQWTSILNRIGIQHETIGKLKTAVEAFATAVDNVHTGGAQELKQLSDAAAAFQSGLQPYVTRRLWRDHPCVQKFARHGGQDNKAHPHRRMRNHVVPLTSLQAEERELLAYMEGLAVASKGLATEHRLKSAGSRHSQALPLISEQARMATKPAGPAEDMSPVEQAKRQRQAYWLEKVQALTASQGDVAAKPEWSLQWHPKVRRAIGLIEEMTQTGKKILVFGEFIAPMLALDRALNIRHYLRHIRKDIPIPLPAGIHLDDPDMLRWLRSEDMEFSRQQIAAFEEDAKRLGARYTLERASLRNACRDSVDAYFNETSQFNSPLPPELSAILVTWLVQQLCTSDALGAFSGSGRRNDVRAAVEMLLLDLKDADPAGKDAGDEDAAQKPFNWRNAVQTVEQELEKDSSGKYQFRMSPHSRVLYGEVKASTRRVRQSTFNNRQLNPQVLIAQSAIASEGLNLHRACRTVVLFHLDWNPGRIEQQIGRVDRQDSAWMHEFADWRGSGEAPAIEIHTIALAGTYDAARSRVVQQRAKVLRSQLFGEVLPLEQLSLLSEEARAAIGEINIDFRPPKQRQ